MKLSPYCVHSWSTKARFIHGSCGVGRGQGAAEQPPVCKLFGLVWPEFSTNSPVNAEKREKQVNASVHGCTHSGSLRLTGALGTPRA